jgi:hypothetical protein
MPNEKVNIPISSSIPKSETCSVIVPLYGFRNDNVIPQLNAENLLITLQRINLFYHKFYLIFVVERKQLPDEIKNILIGKNSGGNVKVVVVDEGSPYLTYIENGVECALNETSSNFIACVNPSVILQPFALDNIIERVNKSDIDICSGYDVRKPGIVVSLFDDMVIDAPKEYQGFDTNFFIAKKPAMQLLAFDPNYFTRYFIDRDIWSIANSKGLISICSERYLYYSFDVNWKKMESRDEFEMDRQYFIKKWGFDPSIKY